VPQPQSANLFFPGRRVVCSGDEHDCDGKSYTVGQGTTNSLRYRGCFPGARICQHTGEFQEDSSVYVFSFAVGMAMIAIAPFFQ